MLKTLYAFHDIERWIRDRNGHPARPRANGHGLIIDFGDQPLDAVPISWDEFLRVLTEHHTPMLVETEPGSRFHRFIFHG